MVPTVLLTVDSLRGDRAAADFLGESLDILTDDYARFENAYSYGVATPFAFPGIVAGTHPEGNGYVPDEATTLAEGFDGGCAAYTNNGYLRPERGYARSFTHFEESPSVDGRGDLPLIERVARRLQKVDAVRESAVATTVYNRYLREPLQISSVPADGMTKLVRRRLNESADDLVWGHWMDPHLPYHPETAVDLPENVPSLQELDELKDRISAADASALSGEELELAEDLYDANVRYFDRHFSELLRWMREQSWYDEALIVVASDHGEYFGEHGQLFHTWDIDPYDEGVHVPLWVKYPDRADAGESFDHVVGLGDIVATVDSVVSEASLDPPSHASPLRQPSGRHVVSVSNTSRRLTEGNGVYFVRRDGSREERGTVSDAGREFAETVPFPEIRNSEGKAMGVEEAERQRRLKNLGYQ